MLFRFRRGSKSSFMLTMLAGVAFVALSVWAWGVDIHDVLQPLLIIVCVVVGLIILAAALVVLFKLVQRLFKKS